MKDRGHSMIRNLSAALVAGLIGMGGATGASAGDWRDEYRCDRADRNCDGRIDRRDRDVDRPPQDRRYRDDRSREDRRYRDRAPSYGSTGSCTFQTARGPVAGYKPEGKDRCCIQTRRGPSCQ